MAILFDQRARDVIAHRRTRHGENAIALHLKRIPHGGHMLAADWALRGARIPAEEGAPQADDVTIYADERLMRYARWHDITISGWRLGPFGYLVVAQEPYVLRHMVTWERTHPAPPEE